jgi:two-component system, LytTR family, sensor kinase
MRMHLEQHAPLKIQDLRHNCGGEVIRSSQRKLLTASSGYRELSMPGQPAWMIWVVSFGVWMFVTLADTGSIYELYRSTGGFMSFPNVLGMECSQILTCFPITPFVFALAIRYPVQKDNWLRRLLMHLAGGLIFTAAHVTLRGFTPYAHWDAHAHGWASAIWDSQAHAFRIQWSIFEQLFLRNIVDDITGPYVLIVLVAHAVAYYRRFRERQLRASQLETQLAKARLQALKSQLQPHFLFNTLHSISALMLTDVPSADRMMTRLSDLLRMSFEDNGTQVTALSHELEFVNGYLEIEKIRFEERLNIILDIAPDTLDAEVPHLLLQPLVENALRHGISRLSAGGEIRIAASHDEHNLYLRVRDNGPGLGNTDALLSKAGLGLKATRERLETLFGNDLTFEVGAPAEGGVEAFVRIPFRLHQVPSRNEIVSADSKRRL